MNRIFLALRAKVGWLHPFPNPDIDAANHPTITSQLQPRLNCFPNHIPAARSRQTDDPALGKKPRLNHPSCRAQERFRHNHPLSCPKAVQQFSPCVLCTNPPRAIPLCHVVHVKLALCRTRRVRRRTPCVTPPPSPCRGTRTWFWRFHSPLVMPMQAIV